MRTHETTRALAFLARNPGEAFDRARSRVEDVVERRRQPSTSFSYEVSADAEERLHGLIGVPFPCEMVSGFERVWSMLEETFAESSSFVGEWVHDADPGLARVAWCLVRHLRPRRVVETGVARGITSRVLLEALGENGDGHLWSIDLPLLRSEWHDQTAAAVPPALRSRWTYVRGSSRRRLPRLLSDLAEIDLFVHDSAHTESNMRFEFEMAWPRLARGGVLVSHDIGMNSAFADFAAAVGVEPLYVHHGEGASLVGVLVKGS